MSGPSKMALTRAAIGLNSLWHGADHPCSTNPCPECMDDGERALEAAHDPALGLDRSVCLRDVFKILEKWEHSEPDYVENDVRSFLGRALGVDG